MHRSNPFFLHFIKNKLQDLCGQYIQPECKTLMLSQTSLGHCSEGHYFRVQHSLLQSDQAMPQPLPSQSQWQLGSQDNKPNQASAYLHHSQLPTALQKQFKHLQRKAFRNPSPGLSLNPSHPSLPKIPANWTSRTFTGQCPLLNPT